MYFRPENACELFRRFISTFESLIERFQGMKMLFQTEDKLKKAATTAQKDKFEKEIKQEVKKLQRIRDFIKLKEAEKDFRDMDQLNDIRTYIETVSFSVTLGNGEFPRS